MLPTDNLSFIRPLAGVVAVSAMIKLTGVVMGKKCFLITLFTRHCTWKIHRNLEHTGTGVMPEP
jgi:hypothetical protein